MSLDIPDRLVTQYGHISGVRFLASVEIFLSSLTAVRLWAHILKVVKAGLFAEGNVKGTYI